MEKLIRAKTVLIKYWWVFAGVLLLVVGFIVGRGKRAPLHEWRDTQKKIEEVEKARDARIAKIEEEREERIREIEENHADVLEDLKDDQRAEYEALRSNPRKLNRYLNSLLPK